jgi:predicted AlkP superfamily phosphohydrolase/phosphomutase/tetratricopeptide (TPR) repeat protein
MIGKSACDSGITAQRVLLVGWDAAEWKIIRPLAAAGLMPNLAGLMARSQSGILRAGHPLLSPTLWTSIVTGEHPTRHGVLGAVEVSGSRDEAIGRAACKTAPIWSILDRAGIPCHAINFPATHPAEPLHGLSVSNLFALRAGVANSVWPASYEQELEKLRVAPVEIDRATLLSFVPQAALDAPDDARSKRIADILAHIATVHAVATWAMQHVPWRFTALCYTGLHQFSHAFMQYHPPRLDRISERDFQMYHRVITAAYRFHDLMLGRLLQLAGPEAHVILVSDHGFHSDPLRPPAVPPTEQTMLGWHRPGGIFISAGPAAHPTPPHPVSVYDIAPTILSLFGIVPAPEYQPAEIPPAETKNESVDYLLKLGYADRPDPQAEFRQARLAKQRRYHLAVAWLDAHEPDQAIPLLEDLIRENPTDLESRTALAHAYVAVGRSNDCRRLVGQFLTEFPNSAPAAAAAGTLELAANRPDRALAFLQQAEELGLRSPAIFTDIGRAYLRLRKFPDARRAFQQAVSLDADLAGAHCGLGMALRGIGDIQAALEECRHAVELSPDDAQFNFELGETLLLFGKNDEARRALENAVEIDPEFIPALNSLGDMLGRLDHPAEAAEYHRRAHLAAEKRKTPAPE